MPDQSSLAKIVRRDPAVLPDALAVGAVTLDRMRQAGLLEAIGRALPLSRRGGYSSTALTAALITYMVSGARVGLRPFFEALDRMTRRRVAAVAGMRLIPTAASLSRGLGGLVHEAVRPAIRALLARPIDGLGIFQHAAVHHLDATGGAWHVLDIDPTVKAFRQRELPEGEGLPPGQRRAAGQPGYTGRHRGELRIRAVPIIHDGSALWLGLQILAKEGSVRDVAAALVDDAVCALEPHGVSVDQVIVRGDGEFGSAAVMEAFIQRGVHFVTRISRYSLLQRNQVHDALAGAIWQSVRQGESAVPREACDLGDCTLVGATEGRPQARIRLIATRIPCRSDEAEDSSDRHGIRMGSYRIELFATSLDAVRWPAPDVAELYMGRSSIENRLLQEDRELGLGRTFSMNPAGQEWAWGVGLLVWNEQICAAWRAKPPRQTRRKQELRPSVEFGRLECAAAEAAVTAAPIPSVGTPPAADDLGSDVLASPLTPVAAGSAASVEPEITTLMAPQSAEPEPFESAERPSVALNTSAPGELPLPAPTATNVSATAATSPLMSTLAGIMSRAYANLGDSGWHIDPQACLVVCPEGQRLKPYNLTSPRSGLPRLSVRSDANACVGCVRRETCFPADRTGAYKQVTRSIPVEETEACAAAIEEMRAKRPARRRLTRRTAPARRTAPTPRAVPRPDLPGPWYAPPERTPPGPWWAERPQFVPTEARRRTRTLPPHFVVRVEIGDVIPIAKPSAHIAQDRARRARRRRTYVEMEARNRLPARTLVKVTVEPRESRAGSTKS